MATKLIELNDGTLVEVEVSADSSQPISGGFAEKVDQTFESIRPILVKVCHPIVDAWQELNRDVEIEQAEVQVGVSFEGEGNLYITKSKAGANLTIKFIVKPKKER
jgi:hypothetical protein